MRSSRTNIALPRYLILLGAELGTRKSIIFAMRPRGAEFQANINRHFSGKTWNGLTCESVIKDDDHRIFVHISAA